jgi:hypothetical protein
MVVSLFRRYIWLRYPGDVLLFKLTQNEIKSVNMSLDTSQE